MPLIGKYLCFALLALSVDLIWGFCGILSLGHGAFFALGGYAMGMYLMRQIGPRGVYANPVLPDFMVFLNWKELPWFWHGFDHFWFAALMVIAGPGPLAFVFGWFAFRSRVTGVYLSIITQAMTFALMLAFFRNDMGFGGNNGLTDFKDILGFPLQSATTRAALFALSALALAGGFSSAASSSPRSSARCWSRSATPKAARASSATGSSITSSRSSRSRPCSRASPARSTCRRSASSIRASSRPANSIEVVIWVAVGGRGTLVGAALGALVVNAGKTWFTGAIPEFWLFALGGLFVVVTLFLPKGILGTAFDLAASQEAARPRRGGRRRRRAAARRSSHVSTDHAVPALSRQRHRLVRRLPRAERALARRRRCRDARHHRPERRRQDDDDGRHHRQDPARRRAGALFAGTHDLTRLDEATIAELGIGRKFQTPTVFDMHTVEDNLLLALKADRRVVPTLFSRRGPQRARAHRRASRTHPAQGSAPAQGVRTLARPEAVARDRHAARAGAEAAAGRRAGRRHDRPGDRRHGRSPPRDREHRSVVVVEHDMTFVRDLDVKVTVLHEGSVLAEGSLDAVSANERVIEVYLGR